MTPRRKYPKTWHLPWSQSGSSDDHWLTGTDHWAGREVVVTEKLDGESTSMYPDYIHARSIDGQSHPCRTRVRGLWGQIRHEIPADWRICGENMEAAHSIWYLNLEALFYCFGIYDQDNTCLSWRDTCSYCDLLGLNTPPVLYQGLWDEKLVRGLWEERRGDSAYTAVETPEDHRVPARPWGTYPWRGGLLELPAPPSTSEGYVVRVADSFGFDDFARSLGKFVRNDHVQTTSHWMSKPVLPNVTSGPGILIGLQG